MSSSAEKIFAKYNSTPDKEWKKIIKQSASNPMIDGLNFPLCPDAAMQRHFVGATLDRVDIPFDFYRTVKNIYESNIREIDSKTKLLDLGSGWGRILRFFMKDIKPSNLFGCDVNPISIDICNTCFRGEVNFQKIKHLPPTLYEDNSFDIIEGYSVFSHLSYQAVVLWLHEYFRLLKPGGLVAITVWKKSRFDYIRKIQKKPPISPESNKYQYNLQSSFSKDCELEEDIYNRAGVVFIPYSADYDVTYGEAFISPELLSSQWSSLFEHVNTIGIKGEQQIVFLRKKTNASKIEDDTVQEIAKIAKFDDIRSICMTNYIRNNKKVSK
ncbi:MAG: class I SAM-dependent methyltransferase [Desulfobacteraceae bacterium]|nr:class I SAM-dependent methyltransferase [Desulfobacteraceae bacterium]